MLLAEQEARTCQARELFRQGLPIAADMVRQTILASWFRSRYEFGVPFDNPTKTVIPKAELKKRQQERQMLCDIAVPIMESLHDFTTGSGFLSTLADEEAVLLKILGDEEIKKRAAADNMMMEGSLRNERHVGTNGIGTALECGIPVQVFAAEHYYPLDPKWICSGAPIFNAEAEPIGVFCLTGLRDRVSFHTLGMAVAAAKAISQQLTMRMAFDSLERFQTQMKIIVEAVPDGIMMVNREMDILQVNKKAGLLLSLPTTEILGKKFHDIFGKGALDASNLREEIRERTVTLGQGKNQQHFFLDVRVGGTEESVVTFQKVEALRKKVNRVIGSNAYFTFEDIIGHSPGISNAISLAKIAAENNTKVLISGESGTGKELFAQAIHNAGRRRNGPFVALNCGALPKSLIESELFGYERGAFTGARREGSSGKFELADSGTIFLDEIGDMPFDVQVSLLRVLQVKEVCRIGSSKPVKIDVRIIAATNKNLLDAIADKTFRSDLYYRLNVFNIHIPPLRERKNDIRPLAAYFLDKYAKSEGKMHRTFSEQAYKLLESLEWRGNVWELENLVEQAVNISRDVIIDVDFLRRLTAGRHCMPEIARPEPEIPHSQPTAQIKEPSHLSLKRKDEKHVIEKALQTTNGNVQKAAALLEVSRRTLYRKMKSFGIVKNCPPESECETYAPTE